MRLLAKKAFCSWACPIGAPSEMLAALSRRVFRRKLGLPRVLDLPLRSLKYLLLAFFAYAVVLQMDARAVADFLDSPYNRVADANGLAPLAAQGHPPRAVRIDCGRCTKACPSG